MNRLPIVSNSSNFETTVTLDNSVYVLAYQYNIRDTSWTFKIKLIDGTNLLTTKLVPNFELLNRRRDSRLPPGRILVFDTTGALDNITDEDLGTNVFLYYVTEEEVEAFQAANVAATAILTGSNPTVNCASFKYNLQTITDQEVIVPSGILNSSNGYAQRGTVALSRDGRTLVVGSPYNNKVAAHAGAAYLFRYEYGAWSYKQELIYDSYNANDHFGTAVAISNDGLTVAISICKQGEAGAGTEKVVIYALVNNQLIKKSEVTAGTPVAGFGRNIALSGLGNRLAVSSGSGSVNNKVWVFDKVLAAWNEITDITPSQPSQNVEGLVVKFSQNGDYLGIGDFMNDTGGTERGYVFAHYIDQGGANNWGEQLASQSSISINNLNFGMSLDFDCSGTVLVVGAPGFQDSGNRLGTAVLYRRTITTWAEVTSAFTPTIKGVNELGYSLALSGDGSILVLGAPAYSTTGRVVVFEDQNKDDTWVEDQVIQFSPTTIDVGETVALADFGGKVLAGTSKATRTNPLEGQVNSWTLYQ